VRLFEPSRLQCSPPPGRAQSCASHKSAYTVICGGHRLIAQRNPPDPPARQRHRLKRAQLAAVPGRMRLLTKHVPCQ